MGAKDAFPKMQTLSPAFFVHYRCKFLVTEKKELSLHRNILFSVVMDHGKYCKSIAKGKEISSLLRQHCRGNPREDVSIDGSKHGVHTSALQR
jgi:hypothetical protein